MLNMWKRNILRKPYRSVIEQRVRRIRTNKELRELHKSPDLVADIKRRKLKWLEHVIRMDQTRETK
jgi:hypothetical protein